MWTFCKTVTFLLLGMICATSPAIACIDIVPFRIEGIRAADAIFVGEPLRYERLSGNPSQTASYALLKVRVRQVIKGHVPREVYLFWSSNFGTRKYLDLPESAIFASSSKYEPDTAHQISEKYPGIARENLLRLSEYPCAGEYILDNSKENIESIRKVLRGEKVDQRDYSIVVSAAAGRSAEREFREEREWRKLKRAAILGLAGLVPILALFAFFWRRRTK